MASYVKVRGKSSRSTSYSYKDWKQNPKYGWKPPKKKKKVKAQPLTAKQLRQVNAAKKAKWAASTGEVKQIRPRRPFVPYNEYLQSDWWASRRLKKLRSQNDVCERCGARATQVHHKHYRTLWCEQDCDLEALCRSCHEGAHSMAQADAHLRSISRQT